MASFSLTYFANASQFHVNGIYFSHSHDVIRDPKVIPCVIIKIPHESTLCTDEMVMAVSVCIKPRFLTVRSHARDKSFLFEQPKGSVNGIK